MSRTLVLGVVAVVLGAAFVRLGCWQLDRAEQRERANSEIRRRLASAPVELHEPPTGADSTRLAWRRVALAGAWRPEQERIVRNRTWRGTPGVDLLTPLALASGGVVWVNRGWVPSPDAATVDASRWPVNGPARLEGWLRPPNAAERLESRAPLVFQPEPGPGLPRRDRPELSGGPHLSYAVQWFAFAAIALVGYAAYAWARARGRLGTPVGPPPGER